MIKKDNNQCNLFVTQEKSDTKCRDVHCSCRTNVAKVRFHAFHVRLNCHLTFLKIYSIVFFFLTVLNGMQLAKRVYKGQKNYFIVMSFLNDRSYLVRITCSE